MDDVEIELKIKPKHPAKFISWLKKHAKLLRSSRQVDYYFDPAHKTFIFKDKKGRKTADNYLRVRVNPDGGAVGLKHYHRELEEKGRPYLDEFETQLDKPSKLLKIFEFVEFKPTAVIDKQRESYRYRQFQFDCDKVKGLGYFVEVELKGRFKNPDEGFNKINKLLTKIGIKDWEEAKGGYVEMMWNK